MCRLVGTYQQFGGTVEMKTVCSPETVVSTHKSTQHHNAKKTINNMLDRSMYKFLNFIITFATIA
jgi:hypothetical protein